MCFALKIALNLSKSHINERLLLDIFANYQINKLAIPHPGIVNLIIVLFLVSVSISFKKRNPESFDLLCRIQTDQLKGIAILMVLIGHLWVHVSVNKVSLIFSGDAVALFLFLSGYGLTISDINRNHRKNQYFSKRIKRVMIPYWGTTILILFFDYFILSRKYSLGNIVMTFLGVNINTTTQHIDYVRWYVSFILLWYILYYCSRFIHSLSFRLIFLFSCAGASFLLSYYILSFGWYHFFSFPLGCTVALKYESFKKMFLEKSNRFVFWATIAIIFTLFYKVVLFNPQIFSYLDKHVYSIFLSLANELQSILLIAGLVTINAFFDYKYKYSAFLVFCGGISYELFLLHGAFLIKYSLIVPSKNPIYISVNFITYIVIMLLLSYCYKTMIKKIC